MKFFTYIAAAFSMLFAAATAYAEVGEEGAAPPDRGFSQTLIMFAVVALFFYFIIWRPEQRRRKALELQRTSLKKGDRVTAMGMIGTILRIDEQTVIVKMYDGAKIEFLKGAISEVHPEGAVTEVKEISEPKER